jgi:hypothetical protein
MTTKALDAWRNRSITTKVFDLCESCGQLRDDVKERYNYLPRVKAVCCYDCLQRMVYEARVMVVSQDLLT